MASLTPQADVVIVTHSQVAPTCGSVSQAVLSVCKHGVITMNVARGERHLLSRMPGGLLLLQLWEFAGNAPNEAWPR